MEAEVALLEVCKNLGITETNFNPICLPDLPNQQRKEEFLRGKARSSDHGSESGRSVTSQRRPGAPASIPGNAGLARALSCLRNKWRGQIMARVHRRKSLYQGCPKKVHITIYLSLINIEVHCWDGPWASLVGHPCVLK